MKGLFKLTHVGKTFGYALLATVGLTGLGGCDNHVGIDTIRQVASNDKAAITFTGYSPTEGQARTMMFIQGSNFGTDISKIKVTIGGREAKVISSDGSEIYCLVPSRADGGYVEVEILDSNGQTSVKHRFNEHFTYNFNTVVGTLCGFEDEEGNSALVDGPFEEAGFLEPCMLFMDHVDGNSYIYFFEQWVRIRRIDLTNRTVETLVNGSASGWREANSIAWSFTRDTMFVNHNQSSMTGAGMYYFLRNEDFRVPHLAMYGGDINCVFTNPVDGTLYAMRGNDAKVYKPTFNVNTQMWDLGSPVMSVASSGQWFQSIDFVPSGNYCQATGRDKHYIWRSMYDWTTHLPQAPSLLAGAAGNATYADGAGSAAKFNQPRQGCFVYNPDYEGLAGIEPYDYYVADMNNHCIRCVTPTGAVTTYAGRGSQSTDGEVAGYIDGDLRQEARFDCPTGICYDETTATFYISDANNHRIRTITVE